LLNLLEVLLPHKTKLLVIKSNSKKMFQVLNKKLATFLQTQFSYRL
jgi:hypothetical protein